MAELEISNPQQIERRRLMFNNNAARRGRKSWKAHGAGIPAGPNF
jgi:hypothetical protein